MKFIKNGHTGLIMSLSDTPLRKIVGKHYSGKSELVERDGLSARVSSIGTITWQYRCRFRDNAIRLRIERYPDLRLSDARKLIPELRHAIDIGLDPRIYLKNKKNKIKK